MLAALQRWRFAHVRIGGEAAYSRILQHTKIHSDALA